MGSKYRIDYKNYDEKCGKEWSTNSLIKCIFMFIKLQRKYDIVDLFKRS